MDLVEFSSWLSETGPSQAIQLTTWAIPAIQTVHIVALSMLFAAALLVALRFAGRGFSSEPLHLLTERFARLIWILLVVLLISGTLLIVAEPGRTITNPVFYAKMIMLLLVIAITAWLSAVSRKQVEKVSGLHRTGAALTILLWVGIMFAGRFIAYYEAF